MTDPILWRHQNIEPEFVIETIPGLPQRRVPPPTHTQTHKIKQNNKTKQSKITKAKAESRVTLAGIIFLIVAICAVYASSGAGAESAVRIQALNF